MPEDQGAPQQAVDSSPTAPATPQAETPSPAQTQAEPPQAEIPTSFGQQIAAKSGLPPDLEKRINEIEKRG
jgi:hypothetical protein